VSISKAQARALADSFLETVGGSKEGLRPRESYSELIVIAGELVEDMQDNLAKGDHNRSGDLSESIIADEPEKNGGKLSIDLLMLARGQFLNKGVKGTRGGTGLYQFKHEHPSQDMLKSLIDGQKYAKSQTFSVDKKRSTSANEKKNASISEVDNAYAAARKILLYGIKPTGFIDQAVVVAEKKVADRLGAALTIDILDSL